MTPTDDRDLLALQTHATFPAPDAGRDARNLAAIRGALPRPWQRTLVQRVGQSANFAAVAAALLLITTLGVVGVGLRQIASTPYRPHASDLASSDLGP